MQQPLELILTRQWASNLAHAVWIINDKGDMIYFNETAEKLLGLHSEFTNQIKAENISTFLKNSSLEGIPIPSESLPVNIALREHRPTHQKMRVRSLDGTSKIIESTAFPIEGQGGRHLGAISIFWEIKEA